MNTLALKIIGTPKHRVWSLDGKERLERTFARVAKLDAAANDVILIDGDWVLDGRLAKRLAAINEVVLIEAGEVAAIRLSSAENLDVAAGLIGKPEQAAKTLGVPVKTAIQLAGTYNDELRKHETPTLIKLNGRNRAEAEKSTFNASYKGVTDFVTKYCWPWPAYHFTRFCAAIGLTPNMVTTLSLVMTVLAFHLFWIGSFGWAIAVAWFMTFLDTVDGKLARVTMTYSAWGNIYDHGIDLIHPPFWYWAWAVGLTATGQAGDDQLLLVSLYIVIGG
ncbi:MAG: CDP-alcohol phosphatidyltransferase family protein [Sphingomonadales bacterium]|mgnify:CR=1 FL=1